MPQLQILQMSPGVSVWFTKKHSSMFPFAVFVLACSIWHAVWYWFGLV